MRTTTTILCTALLLVISSISLGQKIIEPGPPGTINEVIAADTMADGSRAETHYVLRRNGVYLYTQSIGNRGWHLTVEAEEGDGPRPIVKPAAQPGGEEAPRPFNARGDLTLGDLHIDSYDTRLPQPGVPGDNAHVRILADSITVKAYNVRFDRNRFEVFRIDNDFASLFVMNSTISNNYNDGEFDKAWIVTPRGNVMDSLVFVNNTFYNNTAEWGRNREEAVVNYYKFEHNTVVLQAGAPDPGDPAGDDRGILHFHEARELVFRNNLIINPGFIGYDPDLGPQYIVNVDSTILEGGVVPPDGVDIRNNNIWIDPEFTSLLPDSIEAFTEQLFYDPELKLFMNARGKTANELSLPVDFTDAPRNPVEFVPFYYEWLAGISDPPFLLPRDSRILQGPDVEGDLDFSYTADNAVMTGSTQGQPLGALTWFGMDIIPTDDEFVSIITALEAAGDVPDRFELKGNYPNPFNPSTNVVFDLSTPANVSVTVFDLLGHEVLHTPERALPEGHSQSITLNAGALASGTYLYQVRARAAGETVTKTGRMVLLK